MGEAKENINVIMRMQSVQHAQLTLLYTDGSHEVLDVQKWIIDNGWLNFVEKTGGSLRTKNVAFLKEMIVVPDDPEFRPKPVAEAEKEAIKQKLNVQ